MNDKEKQDIYRNYVEQFEESRLRFRADITNAEQKAFDYGVLVVKNSILISGAGLLSIPAIVGLSTDLNVDLSNAIYAAACFSAALLLSIVGAYVIHLNWMFHAAAHQKWWEERQRFLLNDHFPKDGSQHANSAVHSNPYKRRIYVTFWLPHLLVILFLGSLLGAFFFLYASFGVI